MTTDNTPDTGPGGAMADPVDFKVLTEIGIIAHLSDTLLASILPPPLTTAQFGILNHMVRLERRETVSELAAAMQVAQPTMSSTIKRLRTAGLVVFEPDPDDRRVRHVVLTKAGRAMRQAALEAVAPLRDQLVDLVPAQTWQDLLPLLQKVRIVLDENRPPARTRKNPG